MPISHSDSAGYTSFYHALRLGHHQLMLDILPTHLCRHPSMHLPLHLRLLPIQIVQNLYLHPIQLHSHSKTLKTQSIPSDIDLETMENASSDPFQRLSNTEAFVYTTNPIHLTILRFPQSQMDSFPQQIHTITKAQHCFSDHKSHTLVQFGCIVCLNTTQLNVHPILNHRLEHQRMSNKTSYDSVNLHMELTQVHVYLESKLLEKTTRQMPIPKHLECTLPL
mmetsp:Transcript_8895/g.16031  ORF Transcript_8895/g.16031 Transcript_8895/m.16031 type:complete len:222 (+) Transcript_8895:1148-1813(+)